jgi:hypothetical protein
MCIPNHGNTISFWEDLINGRVHFDIFPHLMGFAKDPRISLWALRQTAPLLNCFRIPMYREAYNELLQLQNFLDAQPLWIRMEKTLGFTFGDSIDIPPASSIITISEIYTLI